MLVLILATCTAPPWPHQSVSTQRVMPPGRGLHSSTFPLNVSTFGPMYWGALLVSVTETALVEQRCKRV